MLDENLHKSSGAASWGDRLIEVFVTTYIATMFTRWVEIPTAAISIGMIIWLFWVDKPYLVALGRNKLVLAWGSLASWAFVCSALAIEPDISLTAWLNSFGIHILVIPLFVHVVVANRLERLMQAFLLAIILASILNAAQYIDDAIKGIFWDSSAWLLHRRWAHPLVYFSPFLLIHAISTRGRDQVKWLVVVAIITLMILGTGYRSAWLAYSVAVFIVIGWHFRNMARQTFILYAGLFFAVGVFFLQLPQGEILHQRIAQGFDTSHRLDGTWKPAVDMSLQNLWTGHGMGIKVYANEYVRQAEVHSDWYFGNKPMHPHNFYLMSLFSLGIPGLVLTLLLLSLLIGVFFQHARAPTHGESALSLGLLASLIAYYIVRGNFAGLSWDRMGIFIGIAIGMMLAPKQPLPQS